MIRIQMGLSLFWNIDLGFADLAVELGLGQDRDHLDTLAHGTPLPLARSHAPPT